MQKKLIKADNPRLGQCYQLAYQNVTSNRDSELIHGYITDKFTGRTIDHAWVETGGQIYDPVLDWTVDKVVYFGLFNAEEGQRYTAQEAMTAASHEGTYGPWHDVRDNNWWPTE